MLVRNLLDPPELLIKLARMIAEAQLVRVRRIAAHSPDALHRPAEVDGPARRQPARHTCFVRLVVPVIDRRVGRDVVHDTDLGRVEPEQRQHLRGVVGVPRLKRGVGAQRAQHVEHLLCVVGASEVPARHDRQVGDDFVLHAGGVVPAVLPLEIRIGALFRRQAEPVVLTRADLIVLRDVVAVGRERAPGRRRSSRNQVPVQPDPRVRRDAVERKGIEEKHAQRCQVLARAELERSLRVSEQVVHRAQPRAHVEERVHRV